MKSMNIKNKHYKFHFDATRSFQFTVKHIRNVGKSPKAFSCKLSVRQYCIQ